MTAAGVQVDGPTGHLGFNPIPLVPGKIFFRHLNEQKIYIYRLTEGSARRDPSTRCGISWLKTTSSLTLFLSKEMPCLAEGVASLSPQLVYFHV
jgi:hypothetical protein